VVSAAPSARRRAADLLRLAIAFALAYAVVAVTVVLTRVPDAVDEDAVRRAATVPSPLPTTAPPTLALPPPTVGPVPRQGLADAAVAAAEAVSGGGGFADGPASAAPPGSTIAVLDRLTSEVAVGAGAEAGVLSASLSKLVLAVDMADRRRAEGITIGDVDVRLLQRALGPSDDAAMSALWSRFDGPGAAERVSARLDLDGLATPRDPSQWGEMVVTASAMLQVWEHLLDDVAEEDRELLVGAMAAAPARATDGFDQAFGLLSPDLSIEVGAAKQGWMCCIGGRYHLHSTGIVGSDDRFVLAVLTTTPAGRGWATARDLIDRMVAAATEALAPATEG
jgi:hypothetical protein